ncbi:efflux transporter outer membrane subunit [Verminephrobacter aporrectodeae subsp. tuberculatae]|uniref:Efflux transporter outer membrane subunit n=1 Tax=Verminephrobacter aporrectodeae subsp. tuberculatae TaxID=1110392 RepID=A0ABT3KUE4_9BURK|nr:efflux transporter outer membrane subunit [Verminephrobacter aporrectodeae]MCW5321938.1 efflux transporter outer membrane subunit [Verminephrobacter aporrectodeae subsp. tuberculatae]
MLSSTFSARAWAIPGLSLLLGACSVSPPLPLAMPDAPAQWSDRAGADAPVASIPATGAAWWTSLGDPAIDALIEAAVADNPTLEQAAARVDQARAVAGIAAAQRLPTLTLNGSASRAQTAYVNGTSGSAGLGGNTSQIGQNPNLLYGSAQIDPALSWELDLWGRVRQSRGVANERLAARNADARSTRLAIEAEVARNVVELRACRYSLKVRDSDIASRDLELALIRQRLSAGNVARVDEASAISNLAASHTNRLSQAERCDQLDNALVALSGHDLGTVRTLTSQPLANNARMPEPPPTRPALPATVLAMHPDIVSARREVDAAWADIDVASAERLPRLELDAMLAGQWLTALGKTFSLLAWSVGPTLSGTLLDGGAGSSKVAAARGRYREAVANLGAQLREAVQNVENALARKMSADARLTSSREARQAASDALRANAARWRAGAPARSVAPNWKPRAVSSRRPRKASSTRPGTVARPGLRWSRRPVTGRVSRPPCRALQANPLHHETTQ